MPFCLFSHSHLHQKCIQISGTPSLYVVLLGPIICYCYHAFNFGILCKLVNHCSALVFVACGWHRGKDTLRPALQFDIPWLMKGFCIQPAQGLLTAVAFLVGRQVFSSLEVFYTYFPHRGQTFRLTSPFVILKKAALNLYGSPCLYL